MGGIISYYGGIVTDGLILDLDPARIDSYPKSGTICYNLIKNNLTLVGSPAVTPNNNIFGTLTNGVQFNNTNGGVFTFDGVNDYINLSPHYIPSSDQKVTLMAWFKTSNTGTTVASPFPPNNTIFGELENAGMSGVGVDGGFLSIGYYDYGTPTWNIVRVTGTTVSDDNWHQVAFVLSPSSNFSLGYWSVYLDGQILVNQQLLNGFVYSWIDGIGANLYGGYFNGSMSIIQLYNKLLSGNEILQNYNATKIRFI